MKAPRHSPNAYRLLHEGAIALACAEHSGMRVDEKYLDHALETTAGDIERLQRKLGESKVMRVWRKRFRTKTNFNSGVQLGKVLFEDMGFECPDRTETGLYKVDADTLAKVDHPFIRRYFEITRIQTGRKFLKQIREEVCEGFLHTVFNLHMAKTYRSSSDSPNFQNLPVRDEWLKKLVRSCFRARKGRRIVEIDYKGIEVSGAYCYHKDPNMRKYLLDKTKDMHRDAAAECYKLSTEDVGKTIRYAGKNMFVFPQFYGSWWLDCSRHLWEACEGLKLVTESGVPLKTHLLQQGIKRLGTQNRRNPHPAPGTFEAHIRKVERRFWDKRFPVYAQWRRDWYDEYLSRGWFKTLTGFVCQGYMARNDVINYPVQGSSFHCLLQAFIWLVNEELRKARMKALVIGQIHDSIVGDVPDEEVSDYVELCRYLMTKKLREFWEWIIVPLEIEVEITPIGGSWVEKKEVK